MARKSKLSMVKAGDVFTKGSRSFVVVAVTARGPIAFVEGRGLSLMKAEDIRGWTKEGE